MFGLKEFADKVKGTTEVLVSALGKISDAIERLTERNSEKENDIFRDQIQKATDSGLGYSISAVAKKDKSVSVIDIFANEETEVKIDSFGVCVYYLSDPKSGYPARSTSFKFDEIASIKIEHKEDED